MSLLRRCLLAALVALCLTLATSARQIDTMARYPDIMGCEAACEVAAAGWPFPYLVDYPGLSPVGSVSLIGALLGMDILRPGALAATFLCWWAFIAAMVLITAAVLVRRRR